MFFFGVGVQINIKVNSQIYEQEKPKQTDRKQTRNSTDTQQKHADRQAYEQTRHRQTQTAKKQTTDR